ncbi:helix-turn-helix domain-containing protein [Acinetobacter towneri]|uniref:helix-turn-helix domain-containing protein n=1 Tax=Acinetobacter towneri TaxID=202956 RepID=UPI003A88BB68
MSEISKQVGRLIRKYRVEKNITQENLALLCGGIDRSYLGRIERGEVNLSVEKLYEIANTLEVHVRDLLPK